MSNQELDHTPHQRSVLHILLRIQAGRAPAWLLSQSECGGFDVLTGCGVGSIFVILLLIEAQGGAFLAAVSVLPLFVCFLLVYIPFAMKEYRARRRIRWQHKAGNRELPKC